jgi:hypothetical protein
MGPVVRLSRTALGAAAVALAIAAPAAAHEKGVEVVASGLDNPRGLELAPGKLWVTEAGRGGAGPCVPGPEMTPVCFGLSGALTVVDPWGHGQRRVLHGLPSLANPDGTSATGPSDISAGRNGAWMTIGLGGPSTTRRMLPREGQGMGRLYSLGHHGLKAVADLHAYEVANNPDAAQPGSDVESNPNSVDAHGKPVVVADAGGNDILAVKRKQISLVALLPFGRATPPPPMPGMPAAPPGTMIPVDPVPTSVVRAPDGSLYVGQLTGFPFVPETASVFRIPPGGGAPEVVASGFTLITDIALGKDGSLYVVEFSTQSLLAGPAPGALIRVHPDGRREELAAGRLVAPTGITLGHGVAYVSNHGAMPGTAAEPGGLTGEVLRIPLGH